MSDPVKRPAAPSTPSLEGLKMKQPKTKKEAKHMLRKLSTTMATLSGMTIHPGSSMFEQFEATLPSPSPQRRCALPGCDELCPPKKTYCSAEHCKEHASRQKRGIFGPIADQFFEDSVEVVDPVTEIHDPAELVDKVLFTAVIASKSGETTNVELTDAMFGGDDFVSIDNPFGMDTSIVELFIHGQDTPVCTENVVIAETFIKITPTMAGEIPPPTPLFKVKIIEIDTQESVEITLSTDDQVTEIERMNVEEDDTAGITWGETREVVIANHPFGNNPIEVRIYHLDETAAMAAYIMRESQVVFTSWPTYELSAPPELPSAKDGYDHVSPHILALGRFVGDLDASTGVPTTGSGSGDSISEGDYWRISVNGTIVDLGVLEVGNVVVARIDAAALATDFVVLGDAIQADMDFVVLGDAIQSDVEDDDFESRGVECIEVPHSELVKMMIP